MVKLYETDISGKNWRTQHCIVSLYRSLPSCQCLHGVECELGTCVSRSEKMPSGKTEEPFVSMVSVDWAQWQPDEKG